MMVPGRGIEPLFRNTLSSIKTETIPGSRPSAWVATESPNPYVVEVGSLLVGACVPLMVASSSSYSWWPGVICSSTARMRKRAVSPLRHPLGRRQTDALSALDAVEGVVALPVGFVGEVAGNQVAAGEEGGNAVQVLGAGQSPKFQHVTGQDASGDGNGIFQLLLFSTAIGAAGAMSWVEKQGQ
jgi:hypothetical protein